MNRSRNHLRILFASWIITGILLVTGIGLLIYMLPLLRLKAEVNEVLRTRTESITLGQLLREADASDTEWRHIEAAYETAVNLDRISWNLRSRPTPFVGNLPMVKPQDEQAFNTRQLRSSKELVLPKPEDVYRIFVTGGSFAYSVGAPDLDRTITAYCREELQGSGIWAGKHIEVWNAAIPSWASTHERIRIENWLSEWQPDLVVMLTGTNECHWAYEGLNILALRTYAEDEFFALTNAGMRLGGVEPFDYHPPYRDGWDPLSTETVSSRFIKNVRLANAALRDRGAQLVVALQPTLSEESKKLTDVERMWAEENKDKIEYFQRCFLAMETAMETEREIPLVSLRDVFESRAEPLWIDLYHVGTRGNQLTGEALARALIELKQAGRLD